MPKKKVAKFTDRNNPSVENMEKEFRKLPSQLAAQCRLEMKTLKQQEKNVKAEIKKTANQHKVANTKLSSLNSNKTKKSPLFKKQLAAAKKNLATILKANKKLNVELSNLKKARLTLTEKQVKFNKLSKQLSQIEKELSSKPVKASKIAKPRKQNKKPKTNVINESNVTQAPQAVALKDTDVTELA